jgi:hypothetical protein
MLLQENVQEIFFQRISMLRNIFWIFVKIEKKARENLACKRELEKPNMQSEESNGVRKQIVEKSNMR